MRLADLDPGIRELVKALRERGWETTDSGDGNSKPQEQRTINGAHVVIQLAGADDLIRKAQILAHDLGEISEQRWNVEASYDPADRIALLLVTEK